MQSVRAAEGGHQNGNGSIVKFKQLRDKPKVRSSLSRALAGDEALTAFIGLACAAFAGFLLLPMFRGQIFAVGDLLNQNFPFRKIYADALHNRVGLLWTPNLYSGFYLFGEGQAGMLHPTHLLLYWLLPLKVAFGIELVAPYLFLLAGCYLLFKSWQLSNPAALFGAFLFTFAGTNLTRYQHMNATAVVAHLPWILLTLDGCLTSEARKSRALWSSALAILIASQVLTGHPQAVYLTALIEGGYLICQVGGRLKTFPTAGVASIAWGGFLGLAMGAVQILPTLAALRSSMRARPSLEYLSDTSLQPQEFLQWINSLFWHAGHYSLARSYFELLIYSGGTLVLFLFLWAVLQRSISEQQRSMKIFLIAMSVAGCFLALGKYNLLFQLYSKLPILGLFRMPVRHILLTQFAFSAGAAFALHKIRQSPIPIVIPAVLRRLGIAVALGAVLTAATAIALHTARLAKIRQESDFVHRLAEHMALPSQAAAGCILTVSAVLLLIAASRSVRLAHTGLAVFVVLEVIAIQGSILRRQDIADPFAIAASSARRPPVAAPGPVQAPPWDDLPSILGYKLINGYSGLDPSSVVPMQSETYARIMGAKVFWDGGWKSSPYTRATLRTRNRTATLPNPITDLQGIDLETTALVEVPLDLDSGAEGRLRWTAEQPGEMRLDAQVTGRVVATFGIRYQPEWKILLDHQALPQLRVDGCLLGVVLPAGKHQVELRFEPADFYLGAKLSLAAFAVLLTYLSFSMRWDRGIATL